MKQKHNEGYTLVELLVSMVILAAIVLPTCTGLVLSVRMNAKTDDLMQAQLAVSSTVETLMASGITQEFLTTLVEKTENPTQTQADENTDGAGAPATEKKQYTSASFPGIVFEMTLAEGSTVDCYDIKVMDEAGQVSVDTSIRYVAEQGGGTE